jgi:tetratricopeptide (TPR) repeat protein
LAAPLRIELLAAQGNSKGAVEFARQFALKEGPSKQLAPRLLRAINVARCLHAAGRTDEANRLVREVAGNAPEAVPLVAGWLAGQPKELPGALAMVQKLIEKDGGTVESATVAAQVLINAGAPKDENRFEPLFEKILSAPGALPLTFTSTMSVLREHQQRFADAIAIAQRAIAYDPRDVINLNNKAWFLSAYEGKHAEAIEAVDEVVLLLGPIDSVLDTKGTALLGLKKTDAAVRLFETCVDGTEPTASHYLHLAEAYRLANRLEESQRALNEAKRRGLVNLPPKDQQTLRQLGG